MSNLNYLEYKGNSIFKDQPNHSYFDKPFDDPTDCLFQCLHEIDAHFVKPEQQLEDLNFKNIIVKDPRNQKPIKNLYYDHTQEEKTKVFQSPKRSTMSEKQHELAVRVLQALQLGLQITTEDLYDWSKLESVRMQEKLYFQKFVFECCQISKEKMYTPCRKLLELYRKWYKSKVNRLLKRYSEQTYNTHLGLPQVKQCKNILKNHQISLKNMEILGKLGKECKWHESITKEFTKFNYSLDSYSQVFIDSEDLKESMEDKFQMQFLHIIEEEVSEYPKMYIPLESLLFLVTAGDYIDMPTEMLLNIKESENAESEFNKYIIMDLPLPSRQAGWHTYQQVVEQAVTALVSLKQTKEIDNVSKKTVENSSNNPFKVFTLQEFMQKTSRQPDKLCKFCKTLIKYQLSSPEEDNLEIYTSLDSFIETQDLSLKVEYKPQFGCEILTKYQLLKQWLQFKLLNLQKTICLRLDDTNYQTLVEESLTLNKIEELLYTNYHINSQELLNNLYEFLKMLYNMPLGHYMLRFNPKFKDKLMLCKPSQEITQNTINLHQLLQADITDLEFMSQQDFLPIDANLCSLMHLQHNIMPAAFSPRALVPRRRNITQNSLMKPKKTVQKVKEFKKPKMNNSKMKRQRRRQRLIEEFKTKMNEQQELEREIEMDRKMLGM